MGTIRRRMVWLSSRGGLTLRKVRQENNGVQFRDDISYRSEGQKE